MKSSKRSKTAGLRRRLVKRLPEISVAALLIYAGVSLWLETPNAIFAAQFANHALFGRAIESGNIPPAQKLLFSIPALLLVIFFVEDIIKNDNY